MNYIRNYPELPSFSFKDVSFNAKGARQLLNYYFGKEKVKDESEVARLKESIFACSSNIFINSFQFIEYPVILRYYNTSTYNFIYFDLKTLKPYKNPETKKLYGDYDEIYEFYKSDKHTFYRMLNYEKLSTKYDMIPAETSQITVRDRIGVTEFPLGYILDYGLMFFAKIHYQINDRSTRVNVINVLDFSVYDFFTDRYYVFNEKRNLFEFKRDNFSFLYFTDGLPEFDLKYGKSFRQETRFNEFFMKFFGFSRTYNSVLGEMVGFKLNKQYENIGKNYPDWFKRRYMMARMSTDCHDYLDIPKPLFKELVNNQGAFERFLYLRDKEYLAHYSAKQVYELAVKIEDLNKTYNSQYPSNLSTIEDICREYEFNRRIKKNYTFAKYIKALEEVFYKRSNAKEIRRRDEGYKCYYNVYLLEDYIRMCEQLNQVPIKYPKNLRKLHDDLQDLLNEVKRKHDEKGFKEAYQGVMGYDDGESRFIVVPPKTPEDLKYEGRALSHCVGGYIDSVIRKETRIMFIRDRNEPNLPLYTFEIRGGELVQARGYRNQDIRYASPEAYRLLAKYCRQQGISMTRYLNGHRLYA